MSSRRKSIDWLALSLCALWMIPLAWMIWGSFVSTAEFTGANRTGGFTLENYITALTRRNWTEAAASSVIVVLLTVIGVMSVGAPAAYALARWQEQRRERLLFFISTRILPPAATIAPLIVIFQTLGIMDSKGALVLLGIATQLGFITAVLAAQLMPYERSTEQWLHSQGASERFAAALGIWINRRGAIVLVAALCALFQWNEFFYAATISGGGESQTLPVVASGFLTGQDVRWGPMFAACTLISAPAAVIAWLASRAIQSRFHGNNL